MIFFLLQCLRPQIAKNSKKKVLNAPKKNRGLNFFLLFESESLLSLGPISMPYDEVHVFFQCLGQEIAKNSKKNGLKCAPFAQNIRFKKIIL